ncbi:glycosyltransferase family 2 protein [Alloacidobacterium dinghuense]|uniref:Glycosyltransferase family 2 protein n=1 Tax=Alloacidobacterium dinghuense TaxID=2763107 RepID=A0A7G8BJG8_9BACT|nr:glycosyltransferase family 2 protein [Alloacidobacterium dinghuense]QNI32688.1 glycosyltransferase family 2 protein [Alloacidobacterium dinghuense]
MSLRESALVSVVIPTCKRPHLVARAVESALRQSYSPIEVLVVVDGPDVETARALGGIEDARLRVIVLEENVGGSDARNLGVREACGEWVAFLDDDDQWMPEKIEKQVDAAWDVLLRHPVISSRLRAYGPDGDQVLPRRLYATGENMGEYLFCRDSFFYGDGMLQTSTLLAKRSLLCEVPFVSGLKRHQDWDWLLRVAARPDVEIVMLPEALTLMRTGGQGESVSQGTDWKTSLAWAKQVRPTMSAHAYSFFIATECASRARKCRAGPFVQGQLFWEFLWNGRFGLKQFVIFMSFCLLPENLRHKLRSLRQ